MITIPTNVKYPIGLAVKATEIGIKIISAKSAAGRQMQKDRLKRLAKHVNFITT